MCPPAPPLNVSTTQTTFIEWQSITRKVRGAWVIIQFNVHVSISPFDLAFWGHVINGGLVTFHVCQCKILYVICCNMVAAED